MINLGEDKDTVVQESREIGPGLYTTREVAEILNIPLPTAHYLRQRGIIPSVKIRGGYIISHEEIEKISRVIRFQAPENLHKILGDALEKPVTDEKVKDDILTASTDEEFEEEGTAQAVVHDTLYEGEVEDLQEEIEASFATRNTRQRFGSGIFVLPKENPYFPESKEADVFVTDYNGPDLDAIPGLQEGFAGIVVQIIDANRPNQEFRGAPYPILATTKENLGKTLAAVREMVIDGDGDKVETGENSVALAS